MSRNAGSNLIVLCLRSDKCVKQRGPGQSNWDKKKKRGVVAYSIAAGMNIDFKANDFVNWCILSPHVVDGFVLVFVQLDISSLWWQVKKMDSASCYFFLSVCLVQVLQLDLTVQRHSL